MCYLKEDIQNQFEEWYPNQYATAHPYFNECIPEEGCAIRVAIGRIYTIISYVYLYIDNENQIINVKNSDKTNELIGQYIDLSSFNKDKISGNHKGYVGEIQDGKFIIQ